MSEWFDNQKKQTATSESCCKSELKKLIHVANLLAEESKRLNKLEGNS